MGVEIFEEQPVPIGRLIGEPERIANYYEMMFGSRKYADDFYCPFCGWARGFRTFSSAIKHNRGYKAWHGMREHFISIYENLPPDFTLEACCLYEEHRQEGYYRMSQAYKEACDISSLEVPF